MSIPMIQGKAVSTVRIQRQTDKPHLMVEWELADQPEIRLVKSMVKEAIVNGGLYSRKLRWFWGAAKDAGWDEDEIAYWIIKGDYHDTKMGEDLREVF